MAIKAFEEIQDKYGDIPGDRGAELRRREYAPYFMRMGRAVYIAEGCRFYHPDRIVLEDDARFNIGALVYGSGGVWIGRHARIGPRCFIHSANHEISESELAFFERGYSDAAVRIGDNVLVSANVSILPGAEISDHTFIGCGAVVARGNYPSGSTLLGVPARPSATQSQQAPTAQPELMVYAQTGHSYDLVRHLLSCLGLPQVCIAMDGEVIPGSVKSVLLVGDAGWSPDLPSRLNVWSLADGISPINRPEFPDSRLFKYAYAGRDGSGDADSKMAQSFFWLITRLEKTPGRLSIRELHEWLKMLSLLDIDAARHHAVLLRILTLLQQKCPIGLARNLDFNNALSNPRVWAYNAEQRVLNRINSPIWQMYMHALAYVPVLKDAFMEVVIVRKLKSFGNLSTILKTAAARMRASTAAMRLAVMELRAKAGEYGAKQIAQIAENPKNGQELLAAAVFARTHGLPEEGALLDALLQHPEWAMADVAFPRTRKNGGFCFSPLTIVWLYLHSRTRQPDYQLPEQAGLVFERIEPLAWMAFENDAFVDPDKKLVSCSLLQNWEKFHIADCPDGAQFMLDESSYKAVTRTLEAAWIDVFKTIQHAINAPFIKVKPWPTGYRAAISIRYDVDRPIRSSRITKLARLHARHANAACASWYYFNGHPDIQVQSVHLARHWQEIGIHAELVENTSEGLGVTHHSAPTSDYWRGDTMNQDLGRLGASYCEFMASSLHTPRPAWHRGEQAEKGNIWLTPLHFPLEGSTRDVTLHYFDKLLPCFRDVLNSGGYAIIGSHPDLDQNILIQLLEREKTDDVWFANVHDIVERCKRVMAYGEIYVTHTIPRIGLCAKTDVADLAVEVWLPGQNVPHEISLQMKAGKARKIELSELEEYK